MRSTASRRAIAVLLSVLACATQASAQGVTVDALLARVFNDVNPQPYTMTADFTSVTTFVIPTGKIIVRATGYLVESRTASGEPRQRKATITKLDVPITIRPATNTIRKVLTDIIESEQKPSEIFPSYDVFINEDRPGGRYQIGGVRQDIVTEVITKSGQTIYLKDINFRRAIAKWLFQPSQRASIVRGYPGPYAFSAVVDETGLLHELTLFYDWGHVGNKVSFVMINGRAFWREVTSNTSTEFTGIGRVNGMMVLLLANHCLSCPPR